MISASVSNTRGETDTRIRRIAQVIAFHGAIICLSLGLARTGAGSDYLAEIKPLLKTKCWSCHGPLKQEASLRLDSGAMIQLGGDSGPAVVAGEPSESLILERVSSKDEFQRMPPEGEPLTEAQIDLLHRWIKGGAQSPANEQRQPDPASHWAFQPIRVELPEPLETMASESKHPIDAFVDQKLRESGLQRARRADARTLVRRLSLIMHGLPASLQQIREFDRNPVLENWERLVDDFLSSPRYGERWAQHWLDIVRYADTHGFEVNTPRPNAWPYRDYVIDAFNTDKPYDQFVREQLAGDQLGHDPATGFLVAAPVLLPGQIGKDKASMRLARQDSLDEIIVGTSATFLGITLGCARCHDHKFDPFSQEDYYAMQAFFAGVEYGDREIRDEASLQREKEANSLQPHIETLRRQLLTYEPVALRGRTLIIDDEYTKSVTLLRPKNGHGQNPAGAGRGYRDDLGTADRLPNLSQGRYTWWDNEPGTDVFVYNLKVAGTFQIWISWGVHGSGVHTRDARYILDQDGDLATTEDQQQVAQVDQYYFAGQQEGVTEKKPLWSGFTSVGIHSLSENSKLVVRGGKTGTGITADAIVLQEVLGSPAETPRVPQLRAPVSFAKNIERFEPIEAKRVRFTSFATTNENRYEPCIDELEVFKAGSDRNIALAKNGTISSSSGNYSNTGKHQLNHINDGRFGNDWSWISNQKGSGWVELEFPEPVMIDRIQWGRDRKGKFNDRLSIDYKIEIGQGNGRWLLVASSRDRLPFNTRHDATATKVRGAGGSGDSLRRLANRLQELEKRQAKLRKPNLVYAGMFREPDITHLLARGDPEQPERKISSRVPKIFAKAIQPTEQNEASRRQHLAQWITSEENSLTARVMVNRIWQYHFGEGIVSTPSDLGLNGARPSHPELLDWLASEFMRSGWSIKHLHKLILTSETWRQSSLVQSDAQAIDGDCRLLWRFPTRRLEAEAIRDGMLAVTGTLNAKMGGPGFDFFKTRGGLNGFPPVQEFDAEGHQRMIYAHKIRMERVPTFGAFDCPDAGQPAPKRSDSTTAIQALNLFNSPFVARQATILANKVEAEALSPSASVTRIFEQVLGRSPTLQEQQVTIPIVKEHGLATLCRVLFNSNEFLMIP